MYVLNFYFEFSQYCQFSTIMGNGRIEAMCYIVLCPSVIVCLFFFILLYCMWTELRHRTDEPIIKKIVYAQI